MMPANGPGTLLFEPQDEVPASNPPKQAQPGSAATVARGIEAAGPAHTEAEAQLQALLGYDG